MGRVTQIVGSVLVGGRSGRMGRDKAQLELDGRSLAGRAAALLKALVDEVIVVGSCDLPADKGVVRVEDRYSGVGPLGGVEAALDWASPRPVLVVACDLPGLTLDAVRALLDAGAPRAATSEACAWIATCDGDRQPLAAVYSPGCLRVAREQLDANRRRMSDFIARLEVEQVPLPAGSLVNINSPADLAAVKVAT